MPALKRAFARQAMGLGPGVTGLLAGQGMLPVPVPRRPRVRHARQQVAAVRGHDLTIFG